MSLHQQIRRGLVSIASFGVLGMMIALQAQPLPDALSDEAIAQCVEPAADVIAEPAPAEAVSDDASVEARPNWRSLLPSAIARSRS